MKENRAFDPSRDREFFASLPAQPGVILIELHGSPEPAEPYLARTTDIRRAAERLLSPPAANSKRLNLRSRAAILQYRVTGSKFEQSLVFYEQARRLVPRTYRRRMRLRPPALLKLSLGNPYPRCYVTRRMRADQALYLGPFASRRAAQVFLDAFLDLYKLRRCKIAIRRDPSFPGCMYSEMKMCLAPCFAGCSPEEYAAETGRVHAALETGGAALISEIEAERQQASDALDFERAAALHKRLAKAESVLRELPAIARGAGKLDALILQRAAGEMTVLLVPVRAGTLQPAFYLNFAELAGSKPAQTLASGFEPGRKGESLGSAPPGNAASDAPEPSDNKRGGRTRSAEFILREFLESAAAERVAEGDPSVSADHLALISRWFYSQPRQGEILFPAPAWPYRRILGVCRRLVNPTPLTPASDPPQRPAGR